MPTTTRDKASGSASNALPDVLQFMQLLWAVVHGFERTSKRMSGEMGVGARDRAATGRVLERLAGQLQSWTSPGSVSLFRRRRRPRSRRARDE